MSNVILYSDLSEIYQGQHNLILNEISEYVDVYSEIKNAIENNLKLIVVVRNKYCLSYLQENRKKQEKINEYY